MIFFNSVFHLQHFHVIVSYNFHLSAEAHYLIFCVVLCFTRTLNTFIQLILNLLSHSSNWRSWLGLHAFPTQVVVPSSRPAQPVRFTLDSYSDSSLSQKYPTKTMKKTLWVSVKPPLRLLHSHINHAQPLAQALKFLAEIFLIGWYDSCTFSLWRHLSYLKFWLPWDFRSLTVARKVVCSLWKTHMHMRKWRWKRQLTFSIIIKVILMLQILWKILETSSWVFEACCPAWSNLHPPFSHHHQTLSHSPHCIQPSWSFISTCKPSSLMTQILALFPWHRILFFWVFKWLTTCYSPHFSLKVPPQRGPPWSPWSKEPKHIYLL